MLVKRRLFPILRQTVLDGGKHYAQAMVFYVLIVLARHETCFV